MQSFISETLDTIIKNTTSYNNVLIVLPSQRATVFVKQVFKEKIDAGFLPEIINIEQFINSISGFEKADNIQLLFHFYTVYKKIEATPVSFDVFASWAFTVLQDFNEIDQHLIDAKDIFNYLRDIQRLKKWSVKGNFTETELIKDHYSFLEKLTIYYAEFYALLSEKKIGYQGLIYRVACNEIERYLERNNHKEIIFIGFNALNKSEEFLFQKVLEKEKSSIYWDIDTAFFNGKHQAGKFIRKYKENWKYYEKNELKTIGDTFSKEKNIEVIGASKNTTQVKYAGEILEKIVDFKNTALVLADETLLPITLNSLPKNIEAINITMGYPLKDIPTTNLILAIFQLFVSQNKLQKTAINKFYYKDVLRFLKHQAIRKFLPEINSFSDSIAKQNNTFISQNQVEELVKTLPNKNAKVIANIFSPYQSVKEFIARILDLIDLLKEEVSELEKEYLFRYYTAFTQLKSLEETYHYFADLKTLTLFFKQLIGSESLSFQGEPLKGLQLMGMLETRVLDFENIILLSTNEGVLPANSQQNSFIPFDVKIEFGLPTFREKDAIFSYHFFRLLQRAKNIFIIYNTEHDVFGSGEKSRFVTQLEMMQKTITHKTITPKVTAQKIALKEIKKEASVLEKLKELAAKGISPSALTNYLYNPISFYKQKVLKLKEFDDVEETVAYNTLGTVVHETLDELYTPFIGRLITTDTIIGMQKSAKEIVTKHFKKEFKNGDISTGRNRLIYEVANRFVTNFLIQEKELVKNNELRIIATEENLAAQITIDGIDFPIKIHGQVDRVDQLNGVLRIIDYKTGMVKSAELKIKDFTELRAKEQHKAIQVLLYAYLYTKSKKHDFNQPIEAGIYSFKNLNNKFLSVSFGATTKTSETIITENHLDEFMIQIKEYIKEIYALNKDFLEPAELKY